VTSAPGASDVSIISSGHDIADARLHRLAAALTRAGLRVEVLALGDAAAAPDGVVAARTWPRHGPAHRAWLATTLPWRARGNVVITLDPDGLLAATAARPLRRRRLVADVHEDYVALASDRPWQGLRRRVAVGVARRALSAARRSDLTVVVDDHVPPLDAPHRLVVRNLPDLLMLPSPTARDATPRAVYVGDIRESRGLTWMLDTIAASPGWTLDLIGPVAPADEPVLRSRLASDPGLGARVRLIGRLPPEQAWRLAAGAWVGFCLLAATPAFRAARASKLYEYLAAGIVPVVSDLPRQRELVEQAGSGFVVADTAAAVGVLADLARDATPLGEQAERGRTWVLGVAEAESSGYDDFARHVQRLARG
jgi:glycosyltransferase involved in cell wall biosynthesis